MIYLTSLSDGFNDMAAIFSSMTQAVGAADKVFELIKREPRGTAVPPTISYEGTTTPAAEICRLDRGICRGEVELISVVFEYPSR